jgi:hypothetical protein
MHTISPFTFEFLVDSYTRRIDDWLDDPDESFTGWSKEEFLAWYDGMLQVGKECGNDFWEVAKREGTDYEIDRAKTMLKVAGHQEFADYEPQNDQ